MSAWIDSYAARLPRELVAWARTQPDLATAWASCDRLAWLIDLGAALPLDETSRRALVAAAAHADPDDPQLLRLTPSALRIAEAWACGRDADWFDVLGTMRFVDFQNGAIAVLPLVVTVMLLLQYRFHVAHPVLQAVGFVGLAVLPGCGVVWGLARRRLTARKLRRFGYARAEHDVFAPTRRFARRLPAHLQPGFLSRFRSGWARVADFPTPRLSAS